MTEKRSAGSSLRLNAVARPKPHCLGYDTIRKPHRNPTKKDRRDFPVINITYRYSDRDINNISRNTNVVKSRVISVFSPCMITPLNANERRMWTSSIDNNLSKSSRCPRERHPTLHSLPSSPSKRTSIKLLRGGFFRTNADLRGSFLMIRQRIRTFHGRWPI
jgi:hypothetical protein